MNTAAGSPSDGTDDGTAPPDGGGTQPSMAASLFVIGSMVLLIVVSVVMFGSEVADGPLQVSMTLATLISIAVAARYGHTGAVISKAIDNGINGVVGTLFVILAIGSLIGTLYLCGAVASVVYYGVDLLTADYFYVTVFLLASALSYMLGSSLTTVGALGVSMVGLASVLGVDPAIAAGAVVSGAILGNKVAKISDTANLTVATVGGETIATHSKAVTRTMIPAAIITAAVFLVLGLTVESPQGGGDFSQVKDAVSGQFNVSLLAFLPIVLIVVLSARGMSAFLSLVLPAIAAVVLAGFTQHDLIVSLADDGRSYFGSVIEVGIDTFANGFALDSGNDDLDRVFAGGGTASMLTTIWLVLVAAAFGAIVDYVGILNRVVTPVINWTKNTISLIGVTMASSIGMNLVTADPYTSIELVGRTFRSEYQRQRLEPVVLSTSIADSGTTMSHIIPWNIHGALFAGTLGIAAVEWAPYTVFAYVTPIVSFAIAAALSKKRRVPADQDIDQVYGPEPTPAGPDRTA